MQVMLMPWEWGDFLEEDNEKDEGAGVCERSGRHVRRHRYPYLTYRR